MIKKIANWIRSLISNHYDRCYTDMEYKGVASMGCCCGIMGGDKHSDYLYYGCIECPYLVSVKENEYDGE